MTTSEISTFVPVKYGGHVIWCDRLTFQKVRPGVTADFTVPKLLAFIEFWDGFSIEFFSKWKLYYVWLCLLNSRCSSTVVLLKNFVSFFKC